MTYSGLLGYAHQTRAFTIKACQSATGCCNNSDTTGALKRFGVPFLDLPTAYNREKLQKMSCIYKLLLHYVSFVTTGLAACTYRLDLSMNGVC